MKTRLAAEQRLKTVFQSKGRPLPDALKPGYVKPTKTCPTCQGVGRIPEGSGDQPIFSHQKP